MEAEILTKRCTKCKKMHPIMNFYKDRMSKDGLQHAFKPCTKINNKIFKEKNPDYHERKGKEKYAYKMVENPNFNRERYLKNQNNFLEARDKWSRSVRGRMASIRDSARDRAKAANRIFDIDIDFLENMYNNQNGKCSLTGIDFTLDRNPDKKRVYMPWSPSLDRIDSSLGYTKENVRLVCVMVNLALNKFGDIAFDKMCRSYIKFKGNEDENKQTKT
jgi:hypothetical protein